MIKRPVALFLFGCLLGGLAITAAEPVLGAQSVTLAWNPVTTANVAGYNIYYGSASGNYTNATFVGNVTNATISGLSEGATYYFATTTLDASGLESAFSTEVSYTVPNATAVLQVTPGNISYGTLLAGTSVTNSFEVQNVGTGTLNGSASVSGPFSIVSGGSYSLGTGQTQLVEVVFSPLVASNYNQSVSFTGGGGTNTTVSGSATNTLILIPSTTNSPPSVFTEKVTADINNPISLQFTTNLASPTWQTLGTFSGSTNLSFTNMPAVFIRGVCSNLTGSITLSWPLSLKLNVVGYDIYYGAASHTYTSMVNVGKTTTATITNLTAGKVYYFAIDTCGLLGKISPYLNEITATPQTTGFSLKFTGP